MTLDLSTVSLPWSTPQLALRPGRWVLGADFTGSSLIKADADVITAGLLLDLKTDSKFSLGVTTVFQVLGYALLDFDDAYQLANVGTFSARYAYLATWDIGALFDERPAGHHVSLPWPGTSAASPHLGYRSPWELDTSPGGRRHPPRRRAQRARSCDWSWSPSARAGLAP